MAVPGKAIADERAHVGGERVDGGYGGELIDGDKGVCSQGGTWAKRGQQRKVGIGAAAGKSELPPVAVR